MDILPEGTVAVVTGASRGIGRGVARALGAAGATVYVTGRTVEPGSSPLPGTIGATAAEVSALGGRGIPVRCDHRDDAQVEALFQRVSTEAGRLDILVNNVFLLPGGDIFRPFWELPLSVWDDQHEVGLRSHYVASVFAAPLMLEAGRGLIAHISSYGGAGYQINTAYGVGKAGVDRLAADMAHELKPHGVACVSLWPAVVRTERILAMAEAGALPWSLEGSESPELTGRAIAALATDPELLELSGRVHVVAKLAERYGLVDTPLATGPSS